MTREDFERAKYIQNRIEHIDKVLKFFDYMSENEFYINMIESGVGSKIEQERMEREDFIFVIKAYEDEKQRLLNEFGRL